MARVLLVSADGIYPTSLGGMEVRAADVCSLWAGKHSVQILSRFNVVGGGQSRRWRSPASRALMLSAQRRLSYRLGTAIEKHIVIKNLAKVGTSAEYLYVNKIGDIPPSAIRWLAEKALRSVFWFGDEFSVAAWEVAWSLRQAGRPVDVVTNCEYLGLHYSRALPLSYRVLYEPVPLSFVPRGDISEEPSLIFVGRQTLEKGFDLFCEAAMRVAETRRVRLSVFAPESDLGHQWRSALIGSQIQVDHWGEVTREELAERIRPGDIFVLPSRAEGMSGALIEAMGAGLVPVVSNVGGLSELADSEIGMVLQPGAGVGEWSRVLGELLAESGEARRIRSTSARAKVLRLCDRERWSQVMENLWTGEMSHDWRDASGVAETYRR